VIVSISLVLLLGALIALLLRVRFLRFTDVLLCGTFGFLLASTGIAPLVRTALTAVGRALGALHV
jgi:hypothetical protein